MRLAAAQLNASSSPSSNSSSCDRLVKWEALDAVKSAASIAAGGPAVGYGVGLSVDLDMFNATERRCVESES